MLAVTSRGPASEQDVGTGGSPEQDFLATAVKRFNLCAEAEAFNRQMAVEDLKFKAGDQWPEDIRSSRTIDKRPCLTINKMKTFVHQITNDQRQNRPGINVSPVGDKADIETAKMLKGLIRQIERQSNADIAYDTAFDHAVSMGWGYWRIITEYESEDSFDQSLKIERIRNPFRVYMDPGHQEPDGSDAQWCFISDLIPREEFKRQFPNAAITEWNEQSFGDENQLWDTQTHIRIADYYHYETTKRKLLYLENGHVGFEDELAPELVAMIEADPDMVRKEREVQAKRVKWCKITAYEILEETDWLGKSIPVIKVIGDESDVEGKVTYAGLVRDAKDPQRMYNFWCTSETELIALAPKAPWIIEEGQIEGHEERWAQANIKSLPYLQYKGTSIGGKPAPPPQRQQFAGPPQGVVNAKIGAAQDMQAVTGIRFDATQQERMYDESGKALRELKRVGDLGNFHYVDNLGRSLRYTGRQLVDLIPKYYDTRRVLTILREDDSEQTVTIDPTLGKPYQQDKTEDGGVNRIYNPKVGKYEVAVTIGPSFATKRAEAADSMLQFIKLYPPAGQIAGDLIAKNMDWPGAEEIATRLETLLPPGIQDKGIEDLPPEARGIVMNLKSKLQQTEQQLKQAAALLGDQEKERAVEYEKINKDFTAKMAATQEKWQEALLKAQSEGKENDEAAMAKIAADYEVKMLKVMGDLQLEVKRMALEAETRAKEMAMEHEAREKDRDAEKENKTKELAVGAAMKSKELSMKSEQEDKSRETESKTADKDRKAQVSTSDKDRETSAKQGEAELKQKAAEAKAKAEEASKVKELQKQVKELQALLKKPRRKTTTVTGPGGKTFKKTTVEE